jgi:hypothetical protein
MLEIAFHSLFFLVIVVVDSIFQFFLNTIVEKSTETAKSNNTMIFIWIEEVILVVINV